MSSCGPASRVAVGDTSHLQHLLRGGRGHNAGTARGGHQADAHGAALASELNGHRVRLANLSSPVAPTHGHDAALGRVDAASDGGGHLLGALGAHANVAVVVADGHDALEARTLPGGRLLLHGHDLHHLVLDRVLHEEVGDLVLLNREREQEDLLHRADLTVTHQTAQLGAGHPLLLLALALALSLPLPLALAVLALALALVAAALAEASAKPTTTSVRHVYIDM